MVMDNLGWGEIGSYNGDILQAYKWRNWKLHFMTQETMRSNIERPGMPRLYNLLTDPKELYDLIEKGGKQGEDNFWVLPPHQQACWGA